MDLLKTLPKVFLDKIRHIVALTGFSIDSEWFDYDALNMACEYKQLDLVRFLLKENCRVKKLSSSIVHAETPLHHAVKLGDVKLIKILLSKQASIVASDSKGNTPLHLAFLQFQEKIVDLIVTTIEQTSNYVNAKNNQGLTHMHIVCTRKNDKVISGFLKAGATITESVMDNTSIFVNFTPLDFAVKFKSLEAIRFLQNVSNIDNNNTNNGLTALDLANQQLDEMALIAHHLFVKKNIDAAHTCKQLSYFHLACITDNPALLEKFIQDGACVNEPINQHSVICPLYRPLHFAVENNCLKNIKVLLRYGAEVKHQNDQGMTPLHLVFYKNKEKNDVLLMLYKAVEDLVEENCTDVNGLSYFHVSIKQNDLETVKQFLNKYNLVNRSIYHNARNFSNFTPLHFATLYEQQEIAKLLIEHGANVNANDKGDYGTPLHIAFENGNVELIDLLLKNSALVSIYRLKTRETALHLLVETYKRLAKEKSTPDILERLLMYFERLAMLGCNINAKDSYENTALHLACSNNFRYNSPCVKKLIELGADINAKNCWKWTPFAESLFDATEEEERGEPADYMILYEHVQKLKDLKMTVDCRNDECCIALLNAEEFTDQTLAKKLQQRLNEVEKMKNVKLTEHLSLYDFMQLDATKAVVYVENEMLMEALENEYLMRELYPEFGYLIRLQYRKAIEKLYVGIASTGRTYQTV